MEKLGLGQKTFSKSLFKEESVTGCDKDIFRFTLKNSTLMSLSSVLRVAIVFCNMVTGIGEQLSSNVSSNVSKVSHYL